jgi:3-deoxy-D-manno-octulosonic acid kinase
MLRAGSVRAAVRRDLAAALGPWLSAPVLALPPDAEPLTGGRGAAYRLTLGGDLHAVVRFYRRGGFVARFVADRYLGLRPRPLRELAVTTEVRRRGVRAVEVLGARVEGWLLYRGALVTAEVPAARTLVDALADAPDPRARTAIAAAAAHTVAALHDAGIEHADLNLTNVLVHPASEGLSEGLVATLLDFDRARLGAGPLGAAGRRRNLRRLARSLAKLDPRGALAGADERAAFRRAYGPAGDSVCGS